MSCDVLKHKGRRQEGVSGYVTSEKVLQRIYRDVIYDTSPEVSIRLIIGRTSNQVSNSQI